MSSTADALTLSQMVSPSTLHDKISDGESINCITYRVNVLSFLRSTFQLWLLNRFGCIHQSWQHKFGWCLCTEWFLPVIPIALVAVVYRQAHFGSTIAMAMSKPQWHTSDPLSITTGSIGCYIVWRAMKQITPFVGLCYLLYSRQDGKRTLFGSHCTFVRIRCAVI